MSTKHTGYTPGPWTWEQNGENYVLHAPGGTVLVISNGGLEPMNTDQAIIADAPRLAEENATLRALLAETADTIESFDLLREPGEDALPIVQKIRVALSGAGGGAA